MSEYLNEVEKTQYMSLVIKDEKSLEKYESIWSKISNNIAKKIDKQPVCGEKTQQIFAIKDQPEKTLNVFVCQQ